MSDDLRARMSESDAAHWDEIQRWKDTQMRPIRPRVISQRVRSAALAPLGKAVSIARKVPGGEALTRTVSSAAVGLVELAASASEASVRRKRILKAYRSAGFDVRTLQDIRSLALDDVLAVKPRRTRSVGKALFDRLAGAIGLALISPLLAATAVAIRIDSPGPVFYTQTRVGQNGKPFTMWKFRSMYIDSDARRASVVKAGGDAGNEVMFKDRQDPRITRVGRWIRRLSIDELPQLINVVRGDMSLVGPRPALPVEVAKYDAEALRRLLVKPGLTGLWQISGRSDLSWASTVALDRHYVENRGGALDAKIFAGTLRAVIGGKGAY